MILNDFLPASFIRAFWRIEDGGQFDRDKLRFYHFRNDPFMPIEFSAAAYRLGHR